MMLRLAVGPEFLVGAKGPYMKCTEHVDFRPMLLELQNQEKCKVGDVFFSVLRGWAEDACVLVWCVGLFLPCYADRSSNPFLKEERLLYRRFMICRCDRFFRIWVGS